MSDRVDQPAVRRRRILLLQMRAYGYLGRGRWGRAARVFEKAVAIDPQRANARFGLGLSYQLLG